MNDTPTPRTDAFEIPSEVVLFIGQKGVPEKVVQAILGFRDFARQLERDLSAAQERVRELECAVHDPVDESPLQELGKWLSAYLDEDHWPNAERLLNAALLHQKRAESALASEREARERAERAERERWIHHDTAIAIAQHLKPYLPINEDNVAEMLADIRMGLADRVAAIDSAIAAEKAEGDR